MTLSADPAWGPLPPVLGPCRLVSDLGAGGMGRVVMAELATDRPYAPAGTRVAVKVLHPHLAAEPDMLDRFQREAAIGSRVDHPRVVRTFEFGTERAAGQTFAFLVLEFVEGRTLRDLLKSWGTIPEPVLRHLAAQIARGLRAVHAAGAVHRDLTPSNVMITPDHQVRIMDLGIALADTGDDRLTRTGLFVGTFHYASPEQIGGQAVGPAADLYSLGVLLYEAASGVQPFKADSFAQVLIKHFQHVPPRLGSVAPAVSPLMEEVVAQLLAKEPAERFADATAVAEVFEHGEQSAWWLSRDAAAASRRAPRVGAAGGPADPFVGRDDELAALDAALAATRRDGTGRLVFVQGDQGGGRTRLLREFAGRAAATGVGDPPVTVLYGAFPAAWAPVGRGALGRAVFDHFGLKGLEQVLDVLLAGQRALARSAAALFSDSLAGGAPASLSEDSVHALFADLARHLSADGPLVWLVDDADFASAENVRLLQALARQAEERPLLLVLATVATPAGDPRWAPLAGVPGTRQIVLGRLTADDVTRLVEPRVGSPTLAEEIGTAIRERTEGELFAVVETLRALDDVGTFGRLRDDPGRLHLELAALAVPRSVRARMEDRLARLPEDDRVLLDVAAVDGFEFDPDLLARALDRPRLAVLQQLAAMERRTGVVRAEGSRVRFDHHLLHDAVLSALSPLLRQEYHQALGAALEVRVLATAGRAVTPAEALALAGHLLRGNAPTSGLRWFAPAFDYLAMQAGDQRAAVELAELALDALGDEPSPRRAEVELARAESLRRLGRVDEARAADEAALAIARGAGDPALRGRAKLAIARHAIFVGDYTAPLAQLELALAAAREAGDRTLEAQVLLALGRVHHLRTESEAAEGYFVRQVALARELGDQRLECEGLTLLSNLLIATDRPDDARGYLEAEMAAATAIGFRDSQITASFGLGVVAMWRGDYGAAGGHLTRLLEFSRQNAARTALAHMVLAQYHVECGALVEAARHVTRGLGRAAASHLRHVHAYLQLRAGDLSRAEGRPHDAVPAYEQALAMLREVGSPQGVAEAATALARVRFEMDDVAGAVPLFAEAADIVADRRLGVPGPLPAAYLARAGRRSAGGIAAGAVGRYAEWAEAFVVLYQAGGGDALLARAGKLLGTIAASLGTEASEAFWRRNLTARRYRALL